MSRVNKEFFNELRKEILSEAEGKTRITERMSTMIRLQNNFTTPEQSKRLLELGVPADSADCHLHTIVPINGGVYEEIEINDFRGKIYENDLPCWSVGRLIEIYVYLTSYEYVSRIFKKKFTPMDKILDKLEKDIANGMLDFSKLEE